MALPLDIKPLHQFLSFDRDPVGSGWHRRGENGNNPKFFLASPGGMGTPPRADVQIADFDRNLFSVDVHFPRPFVYINDFIDRGVEMTAKGIPSFRKMGRRYLSIGQALGSASTSLCAFDPWAFRPGR
ncbi:MAG: hypothetical protein ABSF48_15210 [Thermodesulfobacteriota bacterium]|jgi:hypothetical protein